MLSPFINRKGVSRIIRICLKDFNYYPAVVKQLDVCRLYSALVGIANKYFQPDKAIDVDDTLLLNTNRTPYPYDAVDDLPLALLITA